MAFRKDRTTAAQTSANVAGNIVSSLVDAGVVKTAAAAGKAAVEVYQALFAELGPVVDADNEVFAAAEKSGGGGSKGGSRKSSSNGGSNDPASLVMNSGPFKGQTLEVIYGLDEDTAKAEYSYTNGSGEDYITFLTTERNPNDFTRDKATAFLAAVS